MKPLDYDPDVKWAVQWSNGRLSENDARVLIHSYWRFRERGKRMVGIFADAYEKFMGIEKWEGPS